MKRVLSVLAVCVVLFSLMGVSALAQTYDVTPPAVWGLGFNPTTDPMKGCPGNTNVMVQVKASDLGGVAEVQAELKAPGAASWAGHAEFDMTLQADGFWRVWIPRTFFATAGTWWVRAEAEDWAGNVTRTGPKALEVTGCDRTAPKISGIVATPDEIVASHCDGVKTTTIQAIVTDESGVKKVMLWFQTPGSALWTTVPMSRYIGDAYRATIGPFAAGEVMYYIKALDTLNHSRKSATDDVDVTDCP